LLEPGQDLRDKLQPYWAEQGGIRLWSFE
jgi:hypothetical protein